MYTFPERLDEAVNQGGGNHPYIAPDESYLLFDRGDDLVISFRDLDGNWMSPQNLGKQVNSEYMERRPFVTFDGQYLFFSSNKITPTMGNKPMILQELRKATDGFKNGYQHIYWMDAKIIETLKPNQLK
ncbi:hypothetical protein KAR48_17905 [bacterium]|nr:hypothetical protein [bacterium]